jgi:hypothetical protein
MSTLDKIMLGLTLLGLGLNIVLALLPAEWRETHKTAVKIGHMVGFILFGVGIYVLVLSLIPAVWGESMWPKVSMVIGGILLVGGAIWQMSGPSKAQISASDDTSKHVTGATIAGNSQGGPAATVSATGLPGQTAPVVGAEINATGCPGQNVTGLHVTQTGPGTGLHVTATSDGSGSVTGMRVTATSKPCN